MPDYPEKLTEMVGLFASIEDRAERIELITLFADRFQGVPQRIAEPPFPETHRVPGCESQVYVWSEQRTDGTLDFYFAVENPQGVTAMANAVILRDCLSGAPLDEILTIPDEIVLTFFGSELSMAKRVGLMSMVRIVKSHAARKLGFKGV